MLKIYEGGFTSVARDELIKAAKRAYQAGKRVFLFVPEQQTLTAEADMCNALPPEAALSFEVTNFTRFTNTAFRALGGLSGEYVTSAKKALVMWSALTELSPMLTMTRGAKNIGAGTVSRALAAVNELSMLGITPKELEAGSAKVSGEDARLRAKLSDLALVYALYKNKLSEKYADLTEDLSALAKKLGEDGSYLEGTEIFIEGFTSFTKPQYEMIRAMIKHAKVSVLLTVPKGDKAGFEYTEIIDTEDRLASLDKHFNYENDILRPDAKSPEFNSVLSEICDILWRTEGKIDNDSIQNIKDNPEIIRIFEAANPFEECDFIAADIRRRVSGGARWRDFAILTRSLENYQGILDTSLSKAGVPHFMSNPKSINSFEAIKLITTAYSVIVRRFAEAEVLTYSKCGLIGATRDECDLFEMYVTRWNISGSRFTDEELWNMNPSGYQRMNEDDAEKLIRINAIREKIIAPLRTLAENAKAARTVREHAEALLDFLIEIDLEARLMERANELMLHDEEEAANQNARLWQIICDSLDTVVDAVGDTPSDAESFINQLSVVFSDTNMGSIPSYCDEVSVGNADMARFTDKKHVYLIGVNAGEFPKTVSDNSYFTERDKRALSKAGLGMDPDLEIKNARELYAFSRSFSLAHESVTLSYSVKTAALGASLPSDVLERISDITDDAVKPAEISKLPFIDRIYSPEIALENLGIATDGEKRAIKLALAGTEHEGTISVSEGKLENDEIFMDEETVGIVIGNEIYLSQSKIDSYLKCPFKYFGATYLGLNENEKAEINHLVVGKFIHSVLENVFGAVIEDGRSISDLTQKERAALTESSARSYIESELGGISSVKNEIIIDRIRRIARPIVDGLCDEFANCKFTPRYCEMKIDRKNPKNPNSIIYDTKDGKRKVIIGGIIDRIDTLKQGDDVYVRVVDYKTGIKTFTLNDFENGENLQMLLYLKAVTETDTTEFRRRIGVENDGKIIPAGLVYVKTSVADVTIDSPSDELADSEVKKSFERLGASLDSELVLSAMNPDFVPMTKPSRKGEEPKPLTFTEEEWKKMNADMENVVIRIADDIASGHIAAKTSVPDTATFHPCSDCQYKYICRNAVK